MILCDICDHDVEAKYDCEPCKMLGNRTTLCEAHMEVIPTESGAMVVCPSHENEYMTEEMVKSRFI